ncbi:NAD(P)-dependent oxidoreductase [Usitatibacter rugosus]|nr:NAD(P)-dependent oxidoreductase [Usitatibacter rugosus]
MVGTGAMGLGVVRALLGKGFTVRAHDIVAARQAMAVELGAVGCASAAEAARSSSVVITLVVDATQTRDALFGKGGVREGLMAGAVVMMCSTIAPADAESIAAELAGTPMLDAPISGGPARAHAGTLSVMAAGSEPAFAACEAVLAAMSAKCFRVSMRPGDGSRMKVVNNMLAAANLAAGCEAMALAEKLGLDAKQVRDVVNASSGGSWIFTDRMARALEGDFTPHAAARVLTKDVGLFTDVARSLGLETPMADCAREIFLDTVRRGYAEEDDAAVLKRYRDLYEN